MENFKNKSKEELIEELQNQKNINDQLVKTGRVDKLPITDKRSNAERKAAADAAREKAGAPTYQELLISIKTKGVPDAPAGDGPDLSELTGFVRDLAGQVKNLKEQNAELSEKLKEKEKAPAA